MTQLKSLRTSLGASQEDISRRTQLSFTAYRNAEIGKRVRYDTGMQILHAVNELLLEQGKPLVTLEDLGLNLY